MEKGSLLANGIRLTRRRLDDAADGGPRAGRSARALGQALMLAVHVMTPARSRPTVSSVPPSPHDAIASQMLGSYRRD